MITGILQAPNYRPGHDIIISTPEQWTDGGMHIVCEMHDQRNADRLIMMSILYK